MRVAAGDLVGPAEGLAVRARDPGGLADRVDLVVVVLVIIVGRFVGRRRDALRGVVECLVHLGRRRLCAC
jgi:hypothetical protein